MTTVIETSGRPSTGARRLAKTLGIKRLRAIPRIRDGRGNVIINWGCTQKRFERAIYINQPHNVERAGSKIRSLVRMELHGVQVPESTVNVHIAQHWLEEGYQVLARAVDRGHGGIGMRLISQGPLPNVPLYVKYVPKKREYRVHVIGEEVADVQMKRRRNGLDDADVNYQIRVAGNGWVYCRQGMDVPASVRGQAVAAVEALGLDFGAVDIGYTERGRYATVYEVNTAPGLEGETVRIYADNLRRIINAR